MARSVICERERTVAFVVEVAARLQFGVVSAELYGRIEREVAEVVARRGDKL